MTDDNNPRCHVCGRGIPECLNCTYCNAIVPPHQAEQSQRRMWVTVADHEESGESEAYWQEACNPNEGSK